MLGILCGIESEAVIARHIPGEAHDRLRSAARPQKARWLARELVMKKGAEAARQFRHRGRRLSPALPIGSMIIGTHVSSASTANGIATALWINDTDAKAAPEAHLPAAVWGSEYPRSPTARGQTRAL